MPALSSVALQTPTFAVRFDGVDHDFTRSDGARLGVLGELDFSVPRGQFVAIVGRSGSGKSTLLNLAAGLFEPSRGTVTLAGVPPKEAAKRHQIAYVPQTPALLAWRDAVGNVALPYELANRPKSPDHTMDLLRMVKLGGFESSFPHQLSGGMRSRVAIARALSLDPSVLLLDEPLSSLDELTADEVGKLLLDIWHNRRLTVLMVTHSISQAVLFSERVLVLGDRPSTLIADIRVDLPWPRPSDLFLTEPFVRCVGQVKDALYEEHR